MTVWLQVSRNSTNNENINVSLKKTKTKLKLNTGSSKKKENSTQMNFYGKPEENKKDYFYNPDRFNQESNEVKSSEFIMPKNTNLGAFNINSPKRKLV